MKMLFAVIVLISTSLFELTTAVDTANGERVGGCPSPATVSNMTTLPLDNECQVDTDCAGNQVHKCCPDNAGINVCVNPIPACRNGNRLSEGMFFPEGTTCNVDHLCPADTGCEQGPAGEGGWGAGCCGYPAYMWNSGIPRPTCVDGVEPLKDSEGHMFSCSSWSVRGCPEGSACVTDAAGYEICCPTPSSPVCTPGEYYTMPDNLCKECLCGSDGKPTEECSEIACSQIYCPPGTTWRSIPDTCCGQECVEPVLDDVCNLPIVSGPCEAYILSWGYNSDSGQCEEFVYGGCQGNDNRFTSMDACIAKCDKSACDEIACVTGFPSCAEGTTLKISDDPESCCPVYECVKQVCTPGEYYTMPDNPCWDCRCGDDGQQSYCVQLMCSMILCPAGQWAKPIPGTCCGAECVDVPDQDCYLPMVTGPCRAHMPSWGYNSASGRCEQFVYGGCQGNNNRFETEEACIGKCDRSECDTVHCAMPMCAEGTKLEKRVEPDACCPAYDCVKQDKPWIKDGKLSYVGIIAVVLGAVIIIGSILALVFCYLYKNKHNVTESRTDQYYDNLNYSHVDEKKKVPLDSVYIAKEGYDINAAKLQKEKEALQNA